MLAKYINHGDTLLIVSATSHMEKSPFKTTKILS
jgi:hypothetical protein